jgi:hypothetical protein
MLKAEGITGAILWTGGIASNAELRIMQLLHVGAMPMEGV